MQDGGRAAGLPVAEHAEHVGLAVVFALDQDGVVADRLLLLVNLRYVGVHGLGRGLQEADGVVGERIRV